MDALLSSTIPILTIFIFLFCIYIILQKKHTRYTYGPPSYPLIGCLISFCRNRHRLLHWYTHLLAESPTQTIVITRLGARRTIITANPSNLQHILSTNFHNFPKGKPFQEILHDLLGHGIFNVDGELWRTQRKIASHEFSAQALEDFAARVLENETKTHLLPQLVSVSENGSVLDLQATLKKFTFGTICKVLLGVDPNEDVGLERRLDRATAICVGRNSEPFQIVWKMKRILNVGSERRLREDVNVVREWVSDIIRKSVENKSDGEFIETRMDFVSRLVTTGHTLDAVRDMVMSFLLAGRDTTSSALTWFFWVLSRHPDASNRAAEEALVNSSSKMKFITASIMEAMRLYPPVAWDSKHAINEDTLPDGTRVGKGDRVTYVPYAMGRMVGIWGEDCLVFRPQRWLGEDGDLRWVSCYEYPVFQAGPRVCLGKEMAIVQMKYAAREVLMRFEIQAESEEEAVFVPRFTAHMAGGFNVRIQKRIIN